MKIDTTPPAGGPRRTWSGPSVALSLALAACQSPEPAPFVLQPPAVVIEETLEPGSALGPMANSIALPAETDDSDSSPAPIRCRILYLRTPRQASLRALGGDASAVVDLGGASPVLPTPVLTLSTLYAEGDDAKAWISNLSSAADADAMEIASHEGFVPVGSSSRLTVRTYELVEDPRDWLDEFVDRGPIPREVAIIVTQSSEGPRVALSVTDLDPDREAALRESFLEDPSIPATTPPPAQDELVRREVLNIVPQPRPGSPLVLHLDSPFTEGNGSSLAMIVEVLSADEVEGEGEMDTLVALAETAAALETQRQPITEEARHRIERNEALSVFQLRGGRSALLQVAQESGAMLAQDLALVADADFLVALSDRVFLTPAEEAADLGSPQRLLEVDPEPDDPTPIGWRLDSAAWTLLAERALNETLDPELSGVFYRRAGALAAFPDIVQDAVKAARGNRQRFQERLETEQRYFLEDSSPAARLRAHDWLKEQGIEIPGYDPLSDRKERRQALENASRTANEQGASQ